MNRAQIIETIARRLAEVHIRSARRWDTDPARVDEMLPRAIDACWQDRNFTDAATAVLTAIEAMGAVVVPVEPTEGLLRSMAIRYDHGLGVPGYYDQPMFAKYSVSHDQRLAGTMTTMRQLHEEVVGTGFYRAKKDET